jgi:hypothetical protein
VDLLAQSPLRANAVAVADEQHPDDQFGIDRRPTDRTVVGREVSAYSFQVNEPVDGPQQMVSRDMPIDGELVKQRSLIHSTLAHHRLHSRPQLRK